MARLIEDDDSVAVLECTEDIHEELTVTSGAVKAEHTFAASLNRRLIGQGTRPRMLNVGREATHRQIFPRHS